MKPDQRLTQSQRLRLGADYSRVFDHKCRAGDELLLVYVAPNDLGLRRLGLSVSRRVGSAVKRTYIKRRIREVFRLNKQSLPQGLDIVCVPKAAAADRHANLADSFQRLVARAAKRLN